MYTYVEQEKVDGVTTRTGGSTRRSLAALKHLPKVGRPLCVRGYLYKGRHGVNHIGVMVHGTSGTIRFGGFSWGYAGEGPRGLRCLFEALGTTHDPYLVAPWPNFGDADLGDHWKIYLD